MSIPAAVAELNKEIAILDKTISESEKKKSRLVGVRDSLLKEDPRTDSAPATKRKPGRKPGAGKKSTLAKKGAVAKKAVATSKAPARKKRVMSAEAKKRISEAQKKRWAAQKAPLKAS